MKLINVILEISKSLIEEAQTAKIPKNAKVPGLLAWWRILIFILDIVYLLGEKIALTLTWPGNIKLEPLYDYSSLKFTLIDQDLRANYEIYIFYLKKEFILTIENLDQDFTEPECYRQQLSKKQDVLNAIKQFRHNKIYKSVSIHDLISSINHSDGLPVEQRASNTDLEIRQRLRDYYESRYN